MTNICIYFQTNTNCCLYYYSELFWQYLGSTLSERECKVFITLNSLHSFKSDWTSCHGCSG